MKKYKDFADFMQALENLVKKYVKHYKSDFYNYDIARLEENNASKELTDKKLTFIVRDCGTWLIYTDDINKPGTGANTIYNYYLPCGIDNPAKNRNRYYNLNLLDYSIKPLKFDEKGKVITSNRANKKAA